MKAKGTTEFRPPSEIVFEPVIDGVEMATVVGDRTRDAHMTLVRLAEGVRLPLHHYDAALSGVVIGGRVAHPVPSNEDSLAVLEPGAFFSFASGEPHETNNEGAETAVFLIVQEHPWVLHMD